jgi:hypothetical protein
MSYDSLKTANLFRSVGQTPGGSLHQRVSTDLAKSFKGCALGDSGADATIRQGGRLAVVEVKTGDPDLPLPSSTSAQLHLLAREASSNGQFGIQEIFPVLVTNYRVTDADRKELEIDGIKIVTIPSEARYKPADLFKQFVEVAGLVPDNVM